MAHPPKEFDRLRWGQGEAETFARAPQVQGMGPRRKVGRLEGLVRVLRPDELDLAASFRQGSRQDREAAAHGLQVGPGDIEEQVPRVRCELRQDPLITGGKLRTLSPESVMIGNSGLDSTRWANSRPFSCFARISERSISCASPSGVKRTSRGRTALYVNGGETRSRSWIPMATFRRFRPTLAWSFSCRSTIDRRRSSSRSRPRMMPQIGRAS